MRLVEYSFFHRGGSTLNPRGFTSLFVAGFLAATAVGCHAGPPDPHSIRGALSYAAQAIEAHDAERLFRVIDQRARHAMASIVTSRVEAKQLIEADYPENERAAALAALGDGAQVKTPAELFGKRCPEACMAELGARLAAPRAEENAGADVVVHTARGGVLHMHAGNDGWFGLVWNTEALVEERAQAARELEQIRENASVYRKQRELAKTAK
ncbi:MAG TPA: hypothetical protein VHM19_09370 [Polyangiales bacterium]|jgi:hypothetical protein|nr:hypothetical protein [Polyangiales bacterium]